MPVFQEIISVNGNILPTASTVRRIQGEGERLAWSFFPNSTSPVTGIDFRAAVGGTITGQNFRMEIQTDDNGNPSGTVLGAATAEFAGPASNNSWLGIKNLATNTGNLTVNSRYWVVLYWSSGSSPDASNYISIAIRSIRVPTGQEGHKKFDGSSWSTQVAQTVNAVIKRSDDTFQGLAINSGANVSSSDIFGSNRSGYKFRCGSPIAIDSLKFRLAKAGSPADLEIVFYEVSTQKHLITIPSGGTTNDIHFVWIYPKLILLPHRDLFIVFRQASDGGSSSNRYNLRGNTIEVPYREVEIPPNSGLVEGTGNDPTAFTLVDNFNLEFNFMFQSLESSAIVPTPAEIADAVWSHEPRELTS